VCAGRFPPCRGKSDFDRFRAVTLLVVKASRETASMSAFSGRTSAKKRVMP
jgi:hypothetical protein